MCYTSVIFYVIRWDHFVCVIWRCNFVCYKAESFCMCYKPGSLCMRYKAVSFYVL